MLLLTQVAALSYLATPHITQASLLKHNNSINHHGSY